MKHASYEYEAVRYEATLFDEEDVDSTEVSDFDGEDFDEEDVDSTELSNDERKKVKLSTTTAFGQETCAWGVWAGDRIESDVNWAIEVFEELELRLAGDNNIRRKSIRRFLVIRVGGPLYGGSELNVRFVVQAEEPTDERFSAVDIDVPVDSGPSYSFEVHGELEYVGSGRRVVADDILVVHEGSLLSEYSMQGIRPDSRTTKVRIAVRLTFGGKNLPEHIASVEVLASANLVRGLPVVESPVLTIRISADKGKARLHWVITLPAGSGECSGLSNKSEAWEEISSTQRVKILAMLAAAIESPSADHEQMMRRVRTIGDEIYGYWPECVRDSYMALRDFFGERLVIQLICDEPFVPWEFSRPSGAKEPLLLLHPVARYAPEYERPLAPGPDRSGVICVLKPDYVDAPLPFADSEMGAVIGQYDAQRIRAVLSEWRALVEDPQRLESVALLHFMGHGAYRGIENCSYIQLEDGWVSAIDNDPGVPILDGRCGAIALFNSCLSARQGRGRGGFGGWPNSLLNRGFAGFVAPLHAVPDDKAASFTKQLYVEMFEKKKTIAQALLDARIALAAESIEVLSYMYYGNVFARFA